MRKIPRPSRLVVGALAAVVLLAGTGVAAWQLGWGPFEDEGELPTDLQVEVGEPGVSAARSLGDGPPTLLYQSGLALRQVEVLPSEETAGEQPDREVGDVPVASVVASPGSHWIAYTTPADDGASNIVLQSTDREEEEEVSLGRGAVPKWNHTGTAVAFLRPTEVPYNCALAGCSGRSEVLIADVSGDNEVVLEEGEWSLLGWTGGRLLVVDNSEPNQIRSVSLDGEIVDTGIEPAQYISASPDGAWVVIRDQQARLGFQALSDDGHAEGEPTWLEIPDGAAPQDPVWSPLSDRIALVLIEEGLDGGGPQPAQGKKALKKALKEAQSGDKGPTTAATGRVFVAAAGSNELVEVEQTTGAFGPVYWSVDGSGITYTRAITGEAVPISQAMYCPVEAEGSCDVVFSWNEELLLLRMQ